MKLLAVSILAALAVAGSVLLMARKSTVSLADQVPTPVFDSWVHWKQRNAKSYGVDAEESHRLGVFHANFVKVMEHNSKNEGWTMELNQFADLTEAEFLATYTGLKGNHVQGELAKVTVKDAPASYDWTAHGAVNPVKNQGQCGSCWAFATVANIEGARFVQGKKTLESFSEQQLVDCDTTTGDQGCNGGLPSNAYKDMIQNKFGLETETAYPYTGRNGSCAAVASKEDGFINDWKQISTNEDEIAAALVQYGPLSIGINAAFMQMYAGGISKPWSFLCNPSSLDHGVTIVGYGEENGTKFWKIKNSWGSGWGESGYYRIIRGDGRCGVNKMVTTAIVNA